MEDVLIVPIQIEYLIQIQLLIYQEAGIIDKRHYVSFSVEKKLKIQ